MSAEIVSACRADEAPARGGSAEERGLGTLSWGRVVKVASLAGAVAALAATSMLASHLADGVPVPAMQAHGTSVMSSQGAPVP
jgi:hypothetical protein